MDFFGDPFREAERNQIADQWRKSRIETIRRTVSAHDVLRHHGVQLRYSGQRQEQVSCPFHGKDNKPSARVYPATPESPSHVWCFVCREPWDAIALWCKFNGGPDLRFNQHLSNIERTFGIVPPDRPHIEYDTKEVNTESEELRALFGVCEKRLRQAKPCFDLRGYLTLGSILDHLYTRTKKGTVKLAEGKVLLQRVLDKIGERVRACPGA